MAGFLFDVGTRFDEAAVDSFVAKVKQAFAQISSQGGVGAAGQLSDIRSSAAAGLTALREGGADQSAIVAARRELTEALRVQATALFDEIASSKRMTAAQTAAAEKLLQLASSDLRTNVPAVTSLSEAGAFLADRRQKVFENLPPEVVADRGVPGALREAGAEAARMARLGLDAIEGETAEERKLRVLAADRVQTERTRAARAREALATESEEAAAIVQRMVEERTLNRTLNQRVAAEIRARAAAGDQAAQGTLFQRLQAGAAERQGQAPRLPTEFATLGQFITSKAITTAGFAVAGVGLYGGIQSIKEAIEESAKLQEKLNGLRAQFKATDQEAAFPAFRQAVLDIARETGTLASQVASLGPLFVGAFGDGDRAATALRAAVIGIKAGAFTQQDAANISNSLHATFGLAVQEITDQGLHLQDVFGVASDEILKGTADLAPVAKEVGLTFKETSTIIAAASQAAGQPATQIAGLLDRVLPTIQQKAAQVLAVYQSIPALAPKAPQLAADFGQGDTGRVLLEIIRDYQGLNDSQKQSVLTTIGERRELAALIPLLNQSGVAIRELDHGTSGAGRTQQGFDEIMKSIGEQLKRVGEQFRQLGQDLLRAGLGGALHDVAIAGGAVLTVVGGLIRFLGDINDLTHGWAGRITEVVIALRILGPLLRSALASGAVSSIASGIGPALGGLLLGGRGGGSAAATGASSAAAREEAVAAAFARTAGGIGAAETAGAGASFLGGASVAGVAAGPIGIIGATVAATLIADARAKGAAEAKKLKDETRALDDKALNEAKVAHKNIVEQLVGGILGDPDEAAIKQDEQNRRKALPAADDLTALQAGKQPGIHDQERAALLERLRKLALNSLDSTAAGKAFTLADQATSGKDNYDKIIKGVNDGDKASIVAAQAILDQYRKRPGFDVTLSAAKSDLASQLAAAQNKEALDSGQVLVDTQQAVQAYESGDASLGETIANIQKNVDNLRQAKGSDPALNKQYTQALKVQADFNSKTLRQAADLKIQAAEASGEGPEAAVRILTELANNPNFSSPQQRFKAAHDILTAEQKIADNLKHAVDIPPEVRTLLTQEQLDLSPEISTFETLFINGIAGLGDTFDKDLAALVAGGLSINEAIRQLLEQQKAKILEAISKLQGIGGLAQFAILLTELGQIGRAEDAIPAGTDVGPSVPGQVQPTAAKAPSASEIAAARRALAKAQAHGDPVLVAQNELGAANDELAAALPGPETDQANARIIESQDALAKAYQDINRSRLNLAKAQVGDNALEAAKIGKQEADQAAQNAIGAAAQLDAQAQQINADRTLQKAIADVFNSQTELAIAVANAAGDSVKAAQLGAQETRDKISQAIARGAGPAEINQLQAQLVTANAAVVSAQVATRERDIDFALQMGQITTQAAIAQLTGLLALVQGNVADTQAILLKIDQLKKAASQDLQFNIPQEIRLPTLYEARRLNQSGGSQNYQDNRAINITMQVASNTDYPAAFDQIQQLAVQPSNRYGTSGSLYSGA